MALKTSNSELKERLFQIEQLLEIKEGDLEMLKSVIDNDILGISIILNNEGSIKRLTKEISQIKILMLKEYTKGNYELFKTYYENEISQTGHWDFLSESQKKLLKRLNKLYKNLVQKYFENRGDLMLYRKTINSFISSKLKNKESLSDLKEVRSYLINNYSYYDTLKNLGLNPEIGKDGFVKLNKLKLNENGVLVDK